MRRLFLLAVPLTLAACGSEAPGEGKGAAAEQVGASATATLDLQTTGIVVPPQDGFEELAVPFGSDRAPTEATLGNIVGPETDRGTNAECGAGPVDMTSYEGLTLHFQDDKFVGWYATAPYVPELSRAEMLEDPAVELVEGSTLGEEFTIGFPAGEVISGLFTDEGDDARVEALWGGVSCNFR